MGVGEKPGDPTPRELQVGELIFDRGMSQREAATHLGVHPQRVLEALDMLAIKRPRTCSSPVIDVLAGRGCGRCVACQAAHRSRVRRLHVSGAAP